MYVHPVVLVNHPLCAGLTIDGAVAEDEVEEKRDSEAEQMAEVADSSEDELEVVIMDCSSHVDELFWLPHGRHLGASYFVYHKQWLESYVDQSLGRQMEKARVESALTASIRGYETGRILDRNQFGEVSSCAVCVLCVCCVCAVCVCVYCMCVCVCACVCVCVCCCVCVCVCVCVFTNGVF
jgi:hypothetical protein